MDKEGENTPQKSGKIGVFDSGVGGLNTLKALREAMPTHDFHYLGDSARAPYGARGQDELLRFTTEAATYLRAQECSLVIVACNTASTHAMKVLQEKLTGERDTFRLLGILTPVVERALATTKNNRIGVIATQSTVDSGKYAHEVAKFTSSKNTQTNAHKIVVFQSAAPQLANLIETNAPEAEIRAYLKEEIPPLLVHDIDTLVLGCTHYSHVLHLIREALPSHIQIVHEAMCIGDSLREYLARHPYFAKNLSHRGTCAIETTKKTAAFVQRSSRLLPDTPIQEIHIER
jgi:glutamate racemase